MSQKMLAAVLHKKEELRLEEVPIPEISEDEVIIRVKKCGICGTDPHIFKGHFPAPFPLIMGHEFSGEIVNVGKQVKSVAIEAKVTADINISCNHCYFCRVGQKLLCESIKQIGVHVDGAFAEYVKVPQGNIYTLPDEMDWEKAAYIEPLACAIHGLERARMTIGSSVAIIGAGPMGLALGKLAKLNGAAQVILTELNQSRIEKAKAIGVDHVIHAGQENPIEAVKELTEGRGADFVFEAVGSSYTYRQAFEMVRRGGTLIAYGAAPADAAIDIKPFDIFSKELTIVGSYAGSYGTWQQAIQLIKNGLFNPHEIITKTIALEQIIEGINEALYNKDVIKIMVGI
ncbi:zinc-dependent alcohol dehydrogenase family protein [Neobacillus drentensis]|uniref:zinc-dependent alcohol dehydrogenase n=1 Tax=Neobacillus drentensis TaxID=220684 RepID=UPI002FFD6117